MKFIKKNWICFAIYLIVLVPRIVNVLLYAYPLLNPGDELYLFAVPATLAGYDWSSAMPGYRYYGPGFSVFLTPLFKYMEDPVALYRIALVIITCIQGAISLIAYYIMTHYMQVKNKMFLIITSVMLGYALSLQNTYMYNEHIYVVAVWITILMLFKAYEYRNNNKKHMAYTILLSVVMLYALIVHARAVTLMIAVVIIYVLILLFFRIKIVKIVPLVFTLGIGYIGNTLLTNHTVEMIIGSITNSSSVYDSGTLENTSVSFNIPMGILTDSYNQLAFVDIVVGQLNIWNITLGGMAMVSIVIMLYLAWNLYLQKIERTEETMGMVMVGMFCMVCVGITIVGQACSWNAGVAGALESVDNTADALRALFYLRYFYAYVPMILLIVVTYIYKHPRIYLRLYKYILLLTILHTVLWTQLILPFMYDSSVGWGGMSKIYALITLGSDANAIYRYWPGIISVFLLTYFYKILCKHNKAIYISVILLILVGCRYQYSIYSDDNKTQNDYEYTEQVVSVVNYLDQNEVDINVYVTNQQLSSGRYSIVRQLQFLLFDIPLIQGTPEENTENVLYIRVDEETEEYILSDEYKCFVFEENLYLYAKGEEIQNMVEIYIESMQE